MSSPRSSRDLFLPSSLLSSAALSELRNGLRMEDSSLKTFVSSHEKVRFTVLDIFDSPHAISPDGSISEPQIIEHRCSSSNSIQAISHANPDARARIISIRANASTAPLNISFSLMSQIFVQYGVEEEFWEIVRCFGNSPHPAEGGCTHAFARSYPDGSRSSCYDLQYMDDNLRRGENANPWSQRHTGIYHSRMPNPNTGLHSPGGGVHNGARDFDLIIILHPSMDTRFERRIHGLGHLTRNGAPLGIAGRTIARRLQADPGSIHELLLETYLSNWRFYLRSKGDEFQRRLDDLFTMDADIRTVDDSSLGFEAVQQFRYLRDQILTAAAFCRGNGAVIQLLKEVSATQTSSIYASGSAFAERVRGYLSGLDALQSRIDNSIALLEYSLELKHQELAKESNRHMEELTHSTVDDSATVRTITVLGLVYLPGTFVSGLFGMNFFDYNDDTHYMDVAPNFWIYVLLWFIFTGMTYGLYVWAELRRKRLADTGGCGGGGGGGGTGQQPPRSLMPLSVGRFNMRAKGLSNTFRTQRTTRTGSTAGVMNEKAASTTGSAVGGQNLLPTTRTG